MPSIFIGLELCYTESGIQLYQRKYIHDILKDAGLSEAKPVRFPLPQGLKLTLDKGKPLSNAEPYRRLIGSNALDPY